MLFPTLAFAAFFVVVLPLSWLLMPYRLAWGVFMVGASWFFYGSADWRFVPLLMASTVANHFFAWRIHRSSGRSHSTWTVIAVATNLAGLGWFKYIGFLGLSGQSIMRFFGIGWRVPIPEIVLPVGISFFTFQALSYVIDTSRGKIKPVPLLDFAVYLSFFPHLIAGPIVRASEFLPQTKGRIRPRVDLGKAFLLISAGLFKKVVVASYLGTYAVDPLFGFPHQHAGPEALLGVYAYAIQIYADFSGYTDIAIGLALLLGVEFPQNFNAPYAATSLQDFWRRWHMTLSRWLRDYLYIPLGGNRRGRRRTYINVIITMLLGGLWHGAAWTFVAWGALHGIGLAVERRWGQRRNPAMPTPVAETGSPEPPPPGPLAGAGRPSPGWIPALVRVAKRSGVFASARVPVGNGRPDPGRLGPERAAMGTEAQEPASGPASVVSAGARLGVSELPTMRRLNPTSTTDELAADGPPQNLPAEPATRPSGRSDARRMPESSGDPPGADAAPTAPAPPVNERPAAGPGSGSASIAADPESPVFTVRLGAHGAVEAGSGGSLSSPESGAAPAQVAPPASPPGVTPTPAASASAPAASASDSGLAGTPVRPGRHFAPPRPPRRARRAVRSDIIGPTTGAGGLDPDAAVGGEPEQSTAVPAGPSDTQTPAAARTEAPGARPVAPALPAARTGLDGPGSRDSEAAVTAIPGAGPNTAGADLRPTGAGSPLPRHGVPKSAAAAPTPRDALGPVPMGGPANRDRRPVAPAHAPAPGAAPAPAPGAGRAPAGMPPASAAPAAPPTAPAWPAPAEAPAAARTKSSDRAGTATERWVGRLIAFHFVCLTWIFFRATSFHNALEVIGRILSLGGRHRPFNWKVAAVVAAALAVQWAPRRLGPEIQKAYSRAPLWLQGLSLALVLSGIDLLGPAGVAPFIYFRF